MHETTENPCVAGSIPARTTMEIERLKKSHLMAFFIACFENLQNHYRNMDKFITLLKICLVKFTCCFICVTIYLVYLRGV